MPQRKAGWAERSAAARTDCAGSGLGGISRLEPERLRFSRCDEMPSCAIVQKEINAVRRENFNRSVLRTHLSKGRLIHPGSNCFSEIAPDQIGRFIECSIRFDLKFAPIDQ